MGVNEVRSFFIEKGLEDPVFELPSSGATVDEAALTIGVDPSNIAKTLAFCLKDKHILIVTRGDARIDNKKYRQYFNTKARMLELTEVEEVTGHPVGGVCPFGLRNEIEVFLDVSIKGYQYIYPAAGSMYHALKITPEEVQQLTHAEWIDVCQ